MFFAYDNLAHAGKLSTVNVENMQILFENWILKSENSQICSQSVTVEWAELGTELRSESASMSGN